MELGSVLQENGSSVSTERTVQNLLAAIPGWQNRSSTVTPLQHGYNNRSYRVDTANRSYVLRVVDQIDESGMRDNAVECRIQQGAARRGIAAPVEFFSPDSGLLLSEFAKGRSWQPEDLEVPDNLIRLAGLLKVLHSLPLSGVEYDAGIAARNYRSLLRPNAAESSLAALCVQIAESTAKTGRRACCHNDLVAENIVDDGTLKLIDFEYARDNDPYFDLASVINWHNLDAEQAELLLRAYGGVDVDNNRRRLDTQRRTFDAVQWLWLSLQQQRKPNEWQAQQLSRVAGRLSG